MRTAFAVLVVLVACSKSGKQPSESSGASNSGPNYKAQAAALYAQRCASCHGNTGMGDGPISKSLSPPPRNYMSAEWQESVTDREIAETIVMGGAKMGKSAIMPAAPDLADKPELLKALVAHIRSFKRTARSE